MKILITLYFILSFLRLATNFMYLFLNFFHTTWVDIHFVFAIVGITISLFMITYTSQLKEHIQAYRKKTIILLLFDSVFFVLGFILYPQYLKEINLYANAIFGHPLTFLLNLVFLFYLLKNKK
ncbi:hypothetical protein [Tepidibacillus fermentans]|uniref:Uncharacterized protein n=1 Tax=Tepidibacillus fermentans TaxID=1281767 RepID=A0A4R3KI33_9BACI|nr:hypothetical protein [Tepidibacillus fermentans]TCS83155.1 hypothetical protein EDD72_10683 [Tepidibacillus fermentans]